jgi:hypothetical protein
MNRNYILGDLAQRNDTLCSYKNPYMGVHSSFIHNSSKLEITQMSFNE